MRKRLAVVTWYDSVSVAGWRDADPNQDAAERCVTVGWLVSQDDYNLRIACTNGGRGDFLGVVTIPKQAVTSCKEVEDMTLSSECVPDGRVDFDKESA